MVRRLIISLSLIALTGLLATSRSRAAQEFLPENSNPFGVIESTDQPAAADELGIGWTRLTFHWGEIQASGPGSWATEISDEQIQGELEKGRLILGLLIGIPDWARDERKLPQGLWLPHTSPSNRWAAFVAEIVSRYAGRIDHWVIWNEPDIPAGQLAHAWDGTVADFAQLQRAAYLAAKEANPQAIIHLAAFTYWADFYAGTEQYMGRLLDELIADPQAAEHNTYFDVATAHLYFQPNQIYDLLALFLDIMGERGLEKPIWLVETNAPPWNDPDWPVQEWTLSVTLDEQAAFMPQALAAALAAGAERVAVYKLIDTDDDREANPEPFGLLRLDGRRRPAFYTLKQAIDRLSGFFHVERERWDEVGQIRLDQDGQTTTVLFARLPYPQQAEVPATAPDAKLVSMWGDEIELNTEDGLYRIELSPALCTQPIGDYCMIGGTTYYLIQAADISRPEPTTLPTATVVLPTVTASPTPFPTPVESAQVSLNPVPTITPTAISTPTASNPQPRPSPEVSPASAPPADRSDAGPSTIYLWVFAGGLAFGIFFSWRAVTKRMK